MITQDCRPHGYRQQRHHKTGARTGPDTGHRHLHQRLGISGGYTETDLSQIVIDKYLQAIIKEEFSYYSSSGPKYENFSKYLTINEMVRIHYDPYISQFDLSKQPILVSPPWLH